MTVETDLLVVQIFWNFWMISMTNYLLQYLVLPTKCLELKWKLFTAAAQVNVLINFIIGKHFDLPFWIMNTVASLSDTNMIRFEVHYLPHTTAAATMG